MSEGPLLWYLDRATGLTLLVLLTASVVLGVLVDGRPSGPGLPGSSPSTCTATWHCCRRGARGARPHRGGRQLSRHPLVAGTATVRREYEPLWLGLGALSLDLIAVVVITSALAPALSHRAWRSVHYASWAAWVCALAHTLGIGTDIEQGRLWAVVPTAACVLAVCLAAGLRLGRSYQPSPPLPSGRTT